TVLLILAILGATSAGQLGHGHGGHTFGQSTPVTLQHVSPVDSRPFQHVSLPVLTNPEITVPTTISLSGVLLIDGHACIIVSGEITFQGNRAQSFGGFGVFKVLSGFGILTTGERVSLDGGLLHARLLPSTDTEALSLALTQAGISLDLFNQLTGTFPPQHGVTEVIAGVLAINGVYRNIAAGLFVSITIDGQTMLGEGLGTIITEEATSGSGTTGTGLTQTVVITETAPIVTQTIHQLVTLAKSKTLDVYITVTSPIYNIIDATITNFDKQTVIVPTQQVIQSPQAGNVIVNTSPVNTQTVLTVTATSTQYFMQTAIVTVTFTLQHLEKQFSLRTVTVNNTQTSTAVQVITRTSVATAFVTSSVSRTVYTTTTTVVSPGAGTETANTGLMTPLLIYLNIPLTLKNIFQVPTCGSNGVTYEGSCGFASAKCKNPTLEVIPCGDRSPSNCDAFGEPTFCAFDQIRTCGSNGVTYGSSCEFASAKCKNPSLEEIRCDLAGPRCEAPGSGCPNGLCKEACDYANGEYNAPFQTCGGSNCTCCVAAG
ncbi:unnamed protein product, partial [Meganyctiphanes norvegica]